MEGEDIIPADPLVIDAAAVVSETDAALSHSSGDEEGGADWLSRRHQRRRVMVAGGGSGGSARNDESTAHGEGDDDSDDDDAEMKDAAGPDDYYCQNMDDDDEAWVYKHMRSGVRRQQQQRQSRDAEANSDGDENTRQSTKASNGSIRKTTNEGAENDDGQEPSLGKQDGNDSSSPSNPQLERALLLKPRESDAILSCPRCFNIVCMDCQQHERYANQYRAMFVMNIGVDWNRRMLYDEAAGGLKLDSVAGAAGGGGENDATMRLGDEDGPILPDTIPQEVSATPNEKEKEELYYSVHCSYCQEEVAALDMKDEIYYFFGCIASA